MSGNTLGTVNTLENVLAAMIATVKKNPLFGDSNRSVARTSDSLILKLFNQGKRPTVYQVQAKPDRYGNVTRVTFDTIVNEMGKDVHELMKVHWNIKDYTNIENTINRLFEQECQGSQEDTDKNFAPIGLLYRKK